MASRRNELYDCLVLSNLDSTVAHDPEKEHCPAEAEEIAVRGNRSKHCPDGSEGSCLLPATNDFCLFR